MNNESERRVFDPRTGYFLDSEGRKIPNSPEDPAWIPLLLERIVQLETKVAQLDQRPGT